MIIRPYAFICNRFITDIRWYVSLIIAINRLINTIPVRRRYVAMINLTHDSTHESTFFVICKSSGRVNPKRAKNNISNALIGLASSVINEITIKPLKRLCTHIKNDWSKVPNYNSSVLTSCKFIVNYLIGNVQIIGQFHWWLVRLIDCHYQHWITD